MTTTPIIDRLEVAHVLKVRIAEMRFNVNDIYAAPPVGVIRFTENCDEYHSCDLTPAEVLLLADELRALAESMATAPPASASIFAAADP